MAYFMVFQKMIAFMISDHYKHLDELIEQERQAQELKR